MFRTKTRASAVGLSVLAAVAVAAGALLGTQGSAEAEPGSDCSVKLLAGSWMFGTEVGQIIFEPGTPVRDITAQGTMNIDSYGVVSGVFQGTVATVPAGDPRLPAGVPGFTFPATYTGLLTVNPDCTGTLVFDVVETGASRTDSIAVLNWNEMWGMSQDPENLWTYDVRRITGRPHR